MASSPSPVVDAGRRSTSTIAADMELGVGKFISSSAFSVGGHSWCIQYYPDGYTKENADWISVCLELLGKGNDDVRARFRFSLLDQVGEAVPSYSFTSNPICCFNSTNQWGYRAFIKREDLESSPHLKEDSFGSAAMLLSTRSARRKPPCTSLPRLRWTCTGILVNS